MPVNELPLLHRPLASAAILSRLDKPEPLATLVVRTLLVSAIVGLLGVIFSTGYYLGFMHGLHDFYFRTAVVIPQPEAAAGSVPLCRLSLRERAFFRGAKDDNEAN